MAVRVYIVAPSRLAETVDRTIPSMYILRGRGGGGYGGGL